MSRLEMSEDIHCRYVPVQLGPIICHSIPNTSPSAHHGGPVMRRRRYTGAERCRGWKCLRTFIVAMCPSSWGPSSAIRSPIPVPLRITAVPLCDGGATPERSGIAAGNV